MRKNVLPYILALSAILGGCDKSTEDKYRDIERFFVRVKVGPNSDYFLFKNGILGEEPVAVIFGFWEDKEACQKFADRLNQEVTGQAPFFCKAAN